MQKEYKFYLYIFLGLLMLSCINAINAILLLVVLKAEPIINVITYRHLSKYNRIFWIYLFMLLSLSCE